uniref:Uncharacterized protein n=1 Tax=viral metagenome TaxID=1070528 RepID=A0A6C0E0G5_9ZZZZ
MDDTDNKISMLDFHESDKLEKTSSKSWKSKGKSNKDESEDISFSQLEVMANRKKIKKSTEASEKSKARSIAVDDNAKRTLSSSSSSSITVASRNEEKQKRKERQVMKENGNDYIRREKSELLYKFSKINLKGKWSSLKLDMNNSLEEIKNEYERVRSEIQNERSVAFLKRMLLLGVQGIEMMNNRFDPLGMDLDGWSEALGYSLENQEYDEVLAELYEKYKGVGNMSPEVKLIFMIISSATMFTITKKITKMESSNSFMNMIGSMMGKGQQQPPPPQQHVYQQPVYQKPAFETSYGGEAQTGTETSEDHMPSKLQGPNKIVNENDRLDLENILKTMNERKNSAPQAETDNMSATEELLRSIPIAKKKGRGRPRKNALAVN